MTESPDSEIDIEFNDPELEPEQQYTQSKVIVNELVNIDKIDSFDVNPPIESFAQRIANCIKYPNPRRDEEPNQIILEPRIKIGLDILFAFRRGQRNFSKMDISNVDLSKAYLKGIILSSANCTHAKLVGANLATGKFDDADFSSAILKNADLRNSSFRYTNLQSTNLRGSDLCDADLSGANLQDADFCWANLNGAKVTEEQLNQSKTNFTTILPNGTRGKFW
jgi:hypothetical protein